MNFKELTDDEISDFIINDPKLVYMGFSDQELVTMYETKRYTPNPASTYIGIEEDNVLVCVLRWELFTHLTVSIHPYISSSLHGKGMLSKVYSFLYNHFLEDTIITKVIAFVTEPCTHAMKACEKHGFVQEGYISKCVTFRKELCGIYIYGLDLGNKKWQK